MIINHNVSALNAHRHFSQNVKALEHNLETLASGERINRASDDAAGLAVSEKMRAQIRGFKQASRNIQDGVSLIQTAEGHLKESNDVLQRMRELSVQSANGTYTNEDRAQITVEMDQLMRELNRIHEDSKFNTIRLLDGYSLGANSFSGDPPPAENITTARNPNFNVREEGDGLGTSGRNGLVIQSGANTDERMFAEIDAFNSYSLGLTDQPTESYADISGVNNNNPAWREKRFYNEVPIDIESTFSLEAAITPPAIGEDVETGVTITKLEVQEGNRLDISTSESATESITVLDVALNKVNKQRADLGAIQNRLEMAQRGVDLTAENLQASESRIRDADMANEFVKMTKNQILSQSSSSMLAQANAKSNIVMNIIG
ncbi:MAG: flagellin [Spirochaetota bacterium]